MIVKNDTMEAKIIDREWLLSILKHRNGNENKYDFGHALLVCGCNRMIGAALLAVGGASRSGCGLITLHIPEKSALAVNVRYPSVMLSLDSYDCFSSLPQSLDRYDVVGVGCGLGQAEATVGVLGELMRFCFSANTRMVIDADAINIISQNRDLEVYIPANSIFTPHVGELKRLVGDFSSDDEMVSKTAGFARKTESVVLIKGQNSMVVDQLGVVHQTQNGNVGMAKAGSGDVLTGLITGLAARGYTSFEAACLGVWLHGRAGDIAAQQLTQEAMNSNDLIERLAMSFGELYS